MTYTVEIGSAPANAECAQVGKTENFASINRLEVRLYRAAIIAKYGVPPEGVTLRAKANQHDFGTYRELIAELSDAKEGDPEATEYLDQIEDGLFSWLSAGFAPPIRYGPGGSADLGGRTFEDIVAGAMMTTRPKPDGSFCPAENETLHRNLREGSPTSCPIASKPAPRGMSSSRTLATSANTMSMPTPTAKQRSGGCRIHTRPMKSGISMWLSRSTMATNAPSSCCEVPAVSNMETTRTDRAPCIIETLQAIVGVLDMSDPNHPSFADSAADCLDELLRHDADVRALLARAQAYARAPR